MMAAMVRSPRGFPSSAVFIRRFAISFSGKKQKDLNVEFSTQTKNTGTKTLL